MTATTHGSAAGGADRTIQEPPNESVDRLAGLLRTKASDAWRSDHPLVRVLATALAPLGKQPTPGVKPRPHSETASELQRLARTAGVLMREVSLAAEPIDGMALPLLIVTEHDAIHAAVPRGRGFAVTDADGQRTIMTDGQLRDIGGRAFVIAPALGDGPVSLRALLGFGLPFAVGDLLAFAAGTLLAGWVAVAWPMVAHAVVSIVIPAHDTALVADAMVLLALLLAASFATKLSAELALLRLNGRIGTALRFATAERTARICAETGHAPPAPVAALSARAVAGFHRSVWSIVLRSAASILVALPSLGLIVVIAGPAGLLLGLAMTAVLAVAVWVVRRQIKILLTGHASPMSWMATAHETLAQLETVRSYAAERHFYETWSDGFLTLRERFLRVDRAGTVNSAMQTALGAAFLCIGIFALLLSRGAPDSGSTVAFVMALMTVVGAMAGLLGALGQASLLGLQARLIQPILQPLEPPAPAALQSDALRGSIILRELNYRRSPAAPLTIKDVNLEICAGDHIGLTGPSGCGKTTLISLILGLLKPESGAVLIDGRDLAERDKDAFRRSVSVVSQDDRLFPGTLFDNIAIGQIVDQDAVWDALKRACVADDIRGLPLGLSTPVSDTNPPLSGGQVQRLLLARVFLARPKLVILDEATSALDERMQAEIYVSVAALDATIISVAHRLAILKRCKTILVMENGQIVENSPYFDLITRDSLFSKLLASQAT
ncbi:MAG: ATP-binding cassette domain-containing protein [Pseudomonadota bacterium]